MKEEDVRLIEIQLPEDSEIIEALIASRNEEENIDNIEILLYLGKRKKPLKIILRPKGDSLDFDVTTPLHHFHSKMKEEAHIGQAQINKALPIGFQVESTGSNDLYSLSIEIAEGFTDSIESFIKRIKVLKDELGVVKETRRLTGDIFHILPNAKKRFNIVKNKTKLEHFDFSESDPLIQKENNSLALYLDVPVAKSILLPKTLESLKEWKRILSLKHISIPFNGNLKIGYVSSFVYRAHSPRAGDCTYEVVAKCVINSTAAKKVISKFSINPNLLEPTIKASAVKSLEKAYLDYVAEERVVEPYPHPIRYTDCSINEKIDEYRDSTVMTFATNLLDAYDYENIINGSSNYSINLQLENMIFQGEVFCAEIEGVDPRTRKLKNKHTKNEQTYIPRVLLRAKVSNNCKNAILSMRKNQGTIHSPVGRLVRKEAFCYSPVGRLVKREAFCSETKFVGSVFIHKTTFVDY